MAATASMGRMEWTARTGSAQSRRCSVSNSNVEASDTAFYLASQNGAASGDCALAMDENGTGGYWYFTLTNTTAQAVYHDEGDVNDGYTLTFLGSECIYAEAP
jgi:hypothetical protein